MIRTILFTSATAVCVALAGPSFSAEPATSNIESTSPSATGTASATTSNSDCASDIRTFSKTMQKGGYWMGGSDYGYGYPVEGYGNQSPIKGHAAGVSPDYRNVRPGYEIRNLITTANILAQNGKPQACEEVLATTRTIYKSYTANSEGRRGPMIYGADWRMQQIGSALPVTDTTAALRSDQLIDTDVRNAKGEALGSVYDLVIDPKTGKIAYLVVARGGLFGFDEKFVPIPWHDFKVTRSADLLVLDTTKAVVAAAPMATDAQFRAAGQFAAQSKKVDAYWTASLPRKTASR
ncbi:PRC-barrel domain-containing protein [Acidisoma cladoniae]|jgi:sporulation protein YlmC with PRC-barrel domain|uniref:PRC-barrel domain-containing protein n=1 Tax=Acidisoma cladoniae TaxID=3040935 RepID=UPI00254D716C|nr:PRC-barrel domain-containing protein [Acidisoma sp. PAMC 29798]